IAEFHQQYPDITFNITVASTDQIIERLVADETDIGICLNPPTRPDLVCSGWWEEPLELIVAPFHCLSQRQRVSLRELADFPAALPDASFGVRRLVNRLLIRSGVDLKLLVTTN